MVGDIPPTLADHVAVNCDKERVVGAVCRPHATLDVIVTGGGYIKTQLDAKGRRWIPAASRAVWHVKELTSGSTGVRADREPVRHAILGLLDVGAARRSLSKQARSYRKNERNNRDRESKQSQASDRGAEGV